MRRWALALTVLLLTPGCRPSSDVSPVNFRVERGSSAGQIASGLEREELIRSRRLFLVWVRLGGGRAPSIRPGTYRIVPGTSSWAILKQLRKGPQPARATFPEGWTAKQMAAVLESQNVVRASAFLEAVEKGKHEGFLFPDTYVLDQEMTADAVIRRMRQRFAQMVPPDWSDRQRALRLSENNMVTLASIVEREARVPDERPVIAGVFLNRLRKGWRLESCATVEYALGAWKPRLLYKDLQIESPYNTYRHAGLPPGPIGNPGAAALNAAAHPAQTDMMFFVAQGDGTHRFSRYYNEHLKADPRRKVNGKQ